MARFGQSVEQPRWLSGLRARAAELDTAYGWLRFLRLLHRRAQRYKRDLIDPTETAVAVVTPSGDVGQVGGAYDLFIADLSAPDAVLVEAFKRWLKMKRLEVPSPVAKRGKSALNGEFGEDQFSNWRDLRIVEYGALLIWRERLPEAERRAVTLTLIGEWTERFGSNDRKRTMDGLKDALTKLPALAAQAGAEMSAK